MVDTQRPLEEFRQFALVRLSQLPIRVELDDLLREWYDSKYSDMINSTIRQGLADMKASRYKSAETVSQELRSKFGFPPG